MGYAAIDTAGVVAGTAPTGAERPPGSRKLGRAVWTSGPTPPKHGMSLGAEQTSGEMNQMMASGWSGADGGPAEEWTWPRGCDC
jgi:hypothetical protein